MIFLFILSALPILINCYVFSWGFCFIAIFHFINPDYHLIWMTSPPTYPRLSVVYCTAILTVSFSTIIYILWLMNFYGNLLLQYRTILQLFYAEVCLYKGKTPLPAMNRLYVCGCSNIWIVLFKWLNLISTRFTCSPTDGQKPHLAVGDGKPEKLSHCTDHLLRSE
jgi:hypothetical protein